MKSYILFLIGIFVGIFAGYTGKGILSQPDPNGGVKIVGVIDGDTVVTENKSKIRLRQIDAPEVGNCGAGEARELLEKLTLGKTVKLSEEEFEQSQGPRPMYLLDVEGISVNKELLASGWVKYHSDRTTMTEEFKKVAAIARTERLGIFGEKCSQAENKENPKCSIKGNIDPDNSMSRIYQMPGCVQYKTTTVDLWRGESWFCTEKEAEAAGYVKSKRCP